MESSWIADSTTTTQSQSEQEGLGWYMKYTWYPLFQGQTAV